MSSTVPTISSSYSIKARGLNRDLFGDLPVVLDTPSLNLQTLTEKLELLQSEEKRIKEILEKTLPEWRARARGAVGQLASTRSEEHTSELQSLMRISYAVFCLTKKKQHKHNSANTQLRT